DRIERDDRLWHHHRQAVGCRGGRRRQPGRAGLCHCRRRSGPDHRRCPSPGTDRLDNPARQPAGEGDMIRIGVVGYGYWGPNIARSVAETDGTEVGCIADLSAEARERARRRHPTARLVADWHDLVADTGIDAVVVATPVSTHYQIAMAALAAGKHVLVEKP